MWLERLRKMKEANQRIDRHEWSVEKIAIKSEVPKQTLEKIFSGSTKDPKLMTMQRLVYPLGYTLDDLFEEGPLRGPRTFPAHKLGRNVVESKITETYQSKVLLTMRQRFSTARKNGLVLTDPTEDIKITSHARPKKKEYLTLEEQEALMTALESADPRARCFVGLCPG